MPSPITVTANLIDFAGAAVSGYMQAAVVSPTGVYDLYVAGLGILAPKLTTSTIGTSVSVSIWGNDVIVDMVDNAKDTYYTITLFNTSGIVVWTAAYLFTGAGPINLVGYPSLSILPPPITTGPVVAGISSLNALTGAITLSAGSGITLVPVGNNITVAATILSGTQAANLVLAGPATGAATAPTFRALVAADIAGLVPPTTPGGANTDVQFNDSGAFGGNAGFTYNKTTFAVSIEGDVTLSKQIAATSGANQSAPSLILAGTYWDGGASQVSALTITRTVSPGTNPNMNTNFTNTGYGGGGGFTFNGTINANLFNATSIQSATNFLIYGNTPATALTNINFGALNLAGNYWTGSASAPDTWSITPTLGTGTNPTSTLIFAHTGSSGVSAVEIAGLMVPQPAAGVTTPTLTQTIASGSQALGTTLIASGAAAATISVAAAGVLTTDNIMADFNADPTSTTGYMPSASGMLTIIKFPTAGFVNFIVVNDTGAGITPGAITLNWRVVR